MRIRITVDCFSGRPNPTLELDGADAQHVLDKIKIGKAVDAAHATPPRHRLGYRGIIVEHLDGANHQLPQRLLLSADRIFVDQTAAHLDEPGLERTLVSPDSLINRFKLDHYTADVLAKDADASLKPGPATLLPPPWHLPPIIVIQHENPAPVFEPTWWNDGATRQYGNNCYNYACDYRSDSFAQPGLASGHKYTEITSAAVKAGAVSDDLVDMPAANNKFPPAGHLVALVIAPGYDFHWYRKDRAGKWSHKPGGTAATNIDNAGHEITDPRSANRGVYTEFATFMNVKHGHIKIR